MRSAHRSRAARDSLFGPIHPRQSFTARLSHNSEAIERGVSIRVLFLHPDHLTEQNREIQAAIDYFQYITHTSTLITPRRPSSPVPISIDVFESDELPGDPSVPEQVVAFLAANDERAYTRSEIAAALDADPNTVGTALTRLKGRSLVRHRGRYWAITDDRERLETTYQLHTATERLDAQDGGIDPTEWDEYAPDEPHPSERD